MPALSPQTRRASEGNGRPVSAGYASLWLSALSLLAGCSKPYVNAHIESVNAEYRQLEDYVYCLEEENARLQQEIDGLKTSTPAKTTPSKPASPARDGVPRRPLTLPARPQSPASDQSPDLSSPKIELPGSTPPSSTPGGRSTLQRPPLDPSERAAPADTPPSIELPPLLEIPSPAQPSPAKPDEILPVPAGPRDILRPATPERISPKPTDKKVTHLFLNPALTGAADFDGQPGDDGLRVVVEPRNADEQFIAEAGVLSVVLLDPDRQGEAARVARWDFDQSAMRQLIAASSPGRGIKLEVPWPASAPAASRLKMFVRYETPDGRRLQTDREIFVTPPGVSLSRWTPRSADRQPPSAELAVSAASSAAGLQAEPGPIRSASAADIPAQPIWSPNR